MINHIENWFNKASPNPSAQNLNVQIGVHLEEIVEMLDTLRGDNTSTQMAISTCSNHLSALADALKEHTSTVRIVDRIACLDALCDQIVTATGVAVYAGMNMELGLSKVIASNWSKFDRNGNPIFKENGKIAKGPDYEPPYLGECV